MGFNIDEQLVEVNKLSKRKNNDIVDIQDYKLSRCISYLIVKNLDPRKKVVALEKIYFAIQTRYQELNKEDYKLYHFFYVGKMIETTKNTKGDINERISKYRCKNF